MKKKIILSCSSSSHQQQLLHKATQTSLLSEKWQKQEMLKLNSTWETAITLEKE